MKKTHLFVFTPFLILFVFPVFGQNDCKFEKNEIDDFTGEKVIETPLRQVALKFMKREYFDLGFIRNGENYNIKISYKSPEIAKNSLINKEDKLFLKAGNAGDVINLNANNEYLSKMEVIPGTKTKDGVLLAQYKIEKEAFIKLRKDGIQQIRFSFEGNSKSLDFELKPNRQKVLLKDLRCIPVD